MAGQAVKGNVSCGRADVTSMAKEVPRQGQHSMSDNAAPDYRPVRRDEAFGAIEEQLRGLQGLDGAFFSTPSRTSSEAVFDSQFLVPGPSAAGFRWDVSGTPTPKSVPVCLEAVHWACSAGLDCGQKQIVYGATDSGLGPVP
jgi:hypothetical protein